MAGVSQFAHRKLRQLIKTPLLLGEHVRGLEPQVDLIAAEATDFVRADPDYDGGITGVMKIAHAAEGFGLDVEIHAPGPAASPLHGRDPQHQLLRTGAGPPQGARRSAAQRTPVTTPTPWTPSMRGATCRCRRGPAWAWRSTGTTCAAARWASSCMNRRTRSPRPCADRQGLGRGHRPSSVHAGPMAMGRGDRTRTCDIRFWRPTLYQLSYTPMGLRRLL